MQLGKDYKFESDALNTTLFERHVSKKGKETWKPIGYFYDLKELLNRFVDLRIKQTGMKEAKDIQDRIDELKKLYRELAVQFNQNNVQP